MTGILILIYLFIGLVCFLHSALLDKNIAHEIWEQGPLEIWITILFYATLWPLGFLPDRKM